MLQHVQLHVAEALLALVHYARSVHVNGRYMLLLDACILSPCVYYALLHPGCSTYQVSCVYLAGKMIPIRSGGSSMYM